MLNTNKTAGLSLAFFSKISTSVIAMQIVGIDFEYFNFSIINDQMEL
jgi:hypothetical protein